MGTLHLSACTGQVCLHSPASPPVTLITPWFLTGCPPATFSGSPQAPGFPVLSAYRLHPDSPLVQGHSSRLYHPSALSGVLLPMGAHRALSASCLLLSPPGTPREHGHHLALPHSDHLISGTFSSLRAPHSVTCQCPPHQLNDLPAQQVKSK